MSINHFSSDLPETQWWSSANITSSTHQQQDPSRPHPSSRDHFLTPQFYQDPHHHHHNYPPWLINSQQEPTSMPSNFHTQNTPTPTLNFNLNQNDAANDDLSDRAYQFQHESKHLDDADDDKEPMFEKPLTPSDVGKLNRLVIPKQHAEKYFPLGGGDSGLLLSFEDESGKSWRFRYSYWNSSQSYVLTKGWSRYVKEKRLDAGDVVLFERRRAHTDRLFIGWRRRSAPAHDSMSGPSAPAQARGGGGGEMSGSSGTSGSGAGAGGWTRMFYSAPHQYSSYPAHQYHHSVAPYPPDCLHAAGSSGQNSQTTTVGNSKILRLFGVNLECQEHQQQQHEGDEWSEPSTPDGSSSMSMSSQQQLYPAARAYNYADNGDLTFSRDVNPMRNRRG